MRPRTIQRLPLQDRVVPLFENPTVSIRRDGLICEERERLVQLYLTAINRHSELSKTVPLVYTQRWRKSR
jgi:hypothetical protein